MSRVPAFARVNIARNDNIAATRQITADILRLLRRNIFNATFAPGGDNISFSRHARACSAPTVTRLRALIISRSFENNDRGGEISMAESIGVLMGGIGDVVVARRSRGGGEKCYRVVTTI